MDCYARRVALWLRMDVHTFSMPETRRLCIPIFDSNTPLTSRYTEKPLHSVILTVCNPDCSGAGSRSMQGTSARGNLKPMTGTGVGGVMRQLSSLSLRFLCGMASLLPLQQIEDIYHERGIGSELWKRSTSGSFQSSSKRMMRPSCSCRISLNESQAFRSRRIISGFRRWP